MFQGKLLMLRRYDVESESYITYYLTDDKRAGCYHRKLKENFIGDTTIKPTKGALYEIRVSGNLNWKSLGAGEFKLRLASFNNLRRERGWEPIALVS